MMAPPTYFEAIRRRSAERWNQLERDPDLAAPWHQLFKQVQSPRHVLSELLQNADDAGASEASVSLDDKDFAFTHNGEDFREDHFASLCRFGYSNKRALHTIGFRGIGFKSIFSLGPTVGLRSPTLSVAFDSRRFTEPRWVQHPPPNAQVTEVRVAVSDAHRRRELQRNLQEWLNSPLSLLFFRNVRKLNMTGKEIYWGDLGPGPIANSQWLALNNNADDAYLLIRSAPESFPPDALAEIRQERMLSPDQETELPPCAIEIVLGAPGRLYVVLPTGVRTQLPFACNAPFIQDPARLKIKDPETSPTNRWLLARAGALAASAMLEWLGRQLISVAERSAAYGLLPDVDIDDPSLEGICGALVEAACRDALDEKPVLLTDAGELREAHDAVMVPSVLSEIWPSADLSELFDGERRPIFSRNVADEDAQKLVNWDLLDHIAKTDVIAILRSEHLPRPDSWRRLLTLWAYVSPEVTAARYYRSEKDLKIIPVQGQDVLYALTEVVRLGEKRLLQSDADWEFLADHLRVLNPNWPRYLAEQRRSLGESNDSDDAEEIASAYAVLDALGLQDASDASKVLDQVAAQFFAQNEPTTAACIQLAQIAAKLNAAAGPAFRFVTRDNYIRSITDVVLTGDPALEALLPSAWADAHLLHPDYGSPPASCSAEEWHRWVASERAGLSGFVPLMPGRLNVWGRQKIEAELRRRGVSTAPTYHYRYDNFQIDDWDFAEEHWRHWSALAKDDPKVWARVVEHVLNQPESHWSRARTARVSQVATTGNTRQITFDPVLPRWILRLRELPCVFDTHRAPQRPAELLCRTPSTEAVMDVEPFVHVLLDREASRPLLRLLGVRDTPTGPERLLDYLRAFASSENAPAHEVEKWYRRLDQMIDTCSTTAATAIRAAFQNERIVLAEDGAWTTALGAFLLPDDNDAPGVALIRSAVRDLALWRKVGVADQPTADLAIAWLKQLPADSPLSQEDARRVRILLPRHALRIWHECRHWLNLAGEWVPIDSLNYALTMQSLVSWSHLHEWVKKATADLQRLPVEITDTPAIKSLPLLADRIEERLERPPGPAAPPHGCDWLAQLGALIARTQWDDPEERGRIARLGRDLAQSQWQVVPTLAIVPYIDGTPAGTARRVGVLWQDATIYATDRPTARLAMVAAQELGRAFRRPEIADAIKICFERPSQFVADYMEENFVLAPLSLILEPSDVNETTPAPGSPATSDASGANPSHDANISQSEHGDDSFAEAPPSTGRDHDEPESADPRPERERPRPRMPQPSFIERFARSQGFRLNGDGRYCHPDGSWIGKAAGDVFPWERGTAHGNIVRRYWLKDHCIDLEPIQLDAEVWSLIDKFPDEYALVLADSEGNPTEMQGALLRRMREQGALILYPASYRLKVDHDHEQ